MAEKEKKRNVLFPGFRTIALPTRKIPNWNLVLELEREQNSSKARIDPYDTQTHQMSGE